MISHEETMALIKKAQQNDNEALNTLLQQNKPLLKCLIKRYIGKNVEYEDLMQIASIGMLKAVKNFSLDFNVRFSTYAVPMILGEVKRFVRDDGYIKVSRSLKTLSAKINKYIDDYRKANVDEPSVQQIANQFQISSAEVAFALDSAKMPTSLFDSYSDKDGKARELIEKIPSTESMDCVDNLLVKNILNNLEERERNLIVMRYFKDMTQTEIAEVMGISQVQVSRLENKILEKMRCQTPKAS